MAGLYRFFMKGNRIIISLLLVFISAATAMAQKDTLRVLAIGNSFSMDAVEQNLHELGEADGVVLIIGDMYIGGCSLERHYKNSVNNAADYEYCKITADGKKTRTPKTTLETALADEKWDCVTFQQVSQLSGFRASFDPYLGRLLAYVKERVPSDVKFYWHQTWAYAPNAVHDGFVNYGRNQGTMYEAIADASKKVCEDYGFSVIPTGTAIQNLRNTYVEENVTRDGFHLNHTVGRYTAACTWYEALTGRSVVGNSFVTKYVWPDQAPAAQASAHAAVQNPFERTKLSFVRPDANYDEAKVPEYTLPDPLVCTDGKKVKNAKQWYEKRRPELLSLFETEMFGKAPGRPEDLHFKLLKETKNALGGKATFKEVGIYFTEDEKQFICLLVVVPNDAKGPVPAFLGINFMGNHATTYDEAVSMIEKGEYSRFGRFELMPRGENAHRWPYETILDRGYAVATFYRNDIDPDWDDSFTNGVHPLFYKKGQTYPEMDEWGTIGAWAWGMSRALDYLETDADIDATRVVSIGHSRLGKTAIWAGALDTRFAMVVSNDSGCGGAAISRRAVGETLEVINNAFPHWFCGNFKKYNRNESSLPFDQHELLALIAPRPLCVASADQDLWADPAGEKLAAEEAAKVYEFLGCQKDKVNYHVRPGDHNILEYDWQYYLDMADKYLGSPKEITSAGIAPDAKNVWIDFSRDFALNEVPQSVPAKIAVDSKYWLWVNGKAVVFEGGLKRGPAPDASYYDVVDLAPYLKAGNNNIKVLQWYFGKEGFSHKSSGAPAFLFDAPSIGIVSDENWMCRVNTAYGTAPEPLPNYRLPESNIRYDATAMPASWTGAVAVTPHLGPMLERPIPQWKNYGVKPVKFEITHGADTDTLVARLPYNMQMTPVLDIKDNVGGNLVQIQTDHSFTAGTNNIRAEYVTTKGSQTYESYGWMNGDKLIVIVPKNVKVTGLAYRETGYDTAPEGTFVCDDEFFNTFWKKGLRTLYVNMRDTFFDCPERERAQWWGDAVVLMGECFYTYSTSVHALMSKAIHELAAWQKPDGGLFSPVPAGNYDSELPAQMLASVGRYGFWNYYMNTGDRQTIQDVYPAVKKYLSVWEQDSTGLTAYRKAGWNWGDWGDERDMRLIYAGWHHIALEGAANMADLLGYKQDAMLYRAKMAEVKDAFNACWNGNAYRHPEYDGLTDDRVQALAVVSGIASKDKYQAILETLKKEEHASPYMEKYVMEALFEMGYGDYALERTKKRFSFMVLHPEFNTLFEGWGVGKQGFGGGTVNHAWSGGSITVIANKLLGIYPVASGYSEFVVKPVDNLFKTYSITFPTVKGTVGLSCEDGKKWTVDVPEGSVAHVTLPCLAETVDLEGGHYTFSY